jgi:nucleotide-binding universal stress UspA family protein
MDPERSLPMRILLATDGSIPAGVATQLVRRLIWPEGTTIRVVSAAPLAFDVYGMSWGTVTPETAQHQDDEVRKHHDDVLDQAVRDLSRPGLTVERLLLHGRPASRIIEEARKWPADLVVVGHRGRGEISSMVLGSVSTEIVDHAPCPVLVVRRPEVGSVLLATDGSRSALHAEELLASWPEFATTPIRVVAVSPTRAPWAFGMAVDAGAEAYDAFAADATRAREELRPVVDAAVGRLREAGRTVTAEVLDGQPSAAIVATAEAMGEDLVVIGSRGHTGITRLLLGSVARNVLVHAPCSVLVVREHVPVVHPMEPALVVELA